jgi:hypothetical protein
LTSFVESVTDHYSAVQTQHFWTDLLAVLSVVERFAVFGPTLEPSAARLSFIESDLIKAMCTLLETLGVPMPDQPLNPAQLAVPAKRADLVAAQRALGVFFGFGLPLGSTNATFTSIGYEFCARSDCSWAAAASFASIHAQRATICTTARICRAFRRIDCC